MSLLQRTKPALRPSSHINKLLLLPSGLRARAFHASPRPQSIVAASITASHLALTSIHSLTHLPWGYTIPLAALLLRLTIILPISIFQRRATIKQIELAPLLQSWRHVLQRETMQEVGHLGPNAAQNMLLKKARKKRTELYKRYHCGMWHSYLGLVQLPIFLSVMEALRKMCGSREGILGLVMGHRTEVTETGLDNIDGVITGDGLVDQAIRIPVETSLATEGMLWFPDLLVGDPQMVLPFVLSGAILLNVLGGGTATTKWKKRFTRSMGLAALVIGPLMINVPTALLIYWITSSGSAWLQYVLLDKFMPLPTPVVPCNPKRPWKSGLGIQSPAVMEKR